MLSLTLLAIAASASLSPARLQCEAWENPLGVDVERPRLSWIVESSQTGQRQTGYRVLVASDVVKLQSGRADLWDSGEVPSDETRDITYAGRKLRPGQQVFWNVQVWDAQGQPSSPSAAATWTMHILNDRTWRPNWIGMIDRPHPRRGIGFHALEAKSLSEVKWVQVDLQRAVPIDGIVLHKVLDHLGYAVFGFPTAYRVEISDDPTFAHSQLVHEGQEPESAAPVSISAGGKKARYVRVTATGLYRRKDGIGCFALSELEVRSANKNVAAGKPVSAMDSVERDGWTATALTDGWSADDPKTPVTLLLRKDAEIEKPVKRALAYVSGLGQYEMRINGEKVGQDWITPGWTQYANSVLVDSHDVTRMLKAGTNVIGLHLGNGMYDMSGDTRGAQQTNSLGTHKALCRLVIDYADGTRGTIDSDET